MPYSPADFVAMRERRADRARLQKEMDFHFEWDTDCDHHCADCCPALHAQDKF